MCKSVKYVSIKFAKSNLQNALQFAISNVFNKGQARMEHGMYKFQSLTKKADYSCENKIMLLSI
jgi:hypothetical protein